MTWTPSPTGNVLLHAIGSRQEVSFVLETDGVRHASGHEPGHCSRVTSPHLADLRHCCDNEALLHSFGSVKCTGTDIGGPRKPASKKWPEVIGDVPEAAADCAAHIGIFPIEQESEGIGRMRRNLGCFGGGQAKHGEARM